MQKSVFQGQYLHVGLLLIAFSANCSSNVLAAKPEDAQNSIPASAGRMLQQLDEKDWILRAEALRYLGDHRIVTAVDSIRKILNDDGVQSWVRGQALVALARIERKASLNEVARFSQHADSNLRVAAAKAYEKLPGDSDKARLDTLLKDEVPEVRYSALAAYARHHGVDAWATVEPLTQALDRSVCQSGVRALSFVGNDQAMERLVSLSGNQDCLIYTIRGINGVPNPKLIPVLLKILSTLEPEDERFAAALTALAHYQRADLLAAMSKALQQGGLDTIRTVAVVITRLVRSPEIGDVLRKALDTIDDVETVKAGLAALGPREMEPDRHRELFAAGLKHSDADIRALAIRCLAHCNEVNLYDALRERIDDKDSTVAHAALGALLRAPVLTAPRGQLVAYLRVALDSEDETSRTLAYQVLGHAGTEADFKPALAVLGDLLRSTDDIRRGAAADALGRLAPAEGIAQLVRTQGYVANWMVLGTFLNDRQHGGFKKEFPPEEKIDFNARYKAKYVWALAGEGGNKGEIEREIGWNDSAVSRANGKLSVPLLVPPPATLSIAYAVADFQTDIEQEVNLDVDGDDGFRVWLNDEQVAEMVAEYKGRSPCVAEQKGIKVKLKAGYNRFVVKTTNIDHHWWIRLRLIDNQGRPIEISAP